MQERGRNEGRRTSPNGKPREGDLLGWDLTGRDRCWGSDAKVSRGHPDQEGQLQGNRHASCHPVECRHLDAANRELQPRTPWKGGRAGGNGGRAEGRVAVAVNIPPGRG